MLTVPVCSVYARKSQWHLFQNRLQTMERESREASATFLHPLPSSGSIRRHSDPDEVSGIHVVPCDAMELQGLGIWGLCGEGVHSRALSKSHVTFLQAVVDLPQKQSQTLLNSKTLNHDDIFCTAFILLPLDVDVSMKPYGA